MLFVDEFDPHEPFDTPEPWAGRYDPEWEGELLIWPPYDVGAVEAGRLSEREGRQIRANYGAKLSMIDHWVGEVFDALDERGLWESTAVIVCTDHGHYLGEKDIWGKPGRHAVRAPGAYSSAGALAGRRRWDDVWCADDERGHQRDAGRCVRCADGGCLGMGRLWLRCCADRRRRYGEWAIGGVYGNWVQVTDGHGASTPAVLRATTSLCRCGPTAGRPCPCTGWRMRSGCPARPAGPARLHAGIGRAGHPPALRAG